MNRPRVLLLDEPLGALDLKLREEMQLELKAIQQEVGITFIYVTHDQDEALTMSDRLAVFNRGRIEQVGHAGGRLRAAGDGVRGGVRRHVEPPARRRRQGDRRGDGHVHRAARRRSALLQPGARRVRRRDRRRGDASGTSSISGRTRGTSWRSTSGGELVVTQQNLTTSSMDVLAAQGRAVRLDLEAAHNFPVGETERDGTAIT